MVYMDLCPCKEVAASYARGMLSDRCRIDAYCRIPYGDLVWEKRIIDKKSEIPGNRQKVWDGGPEGCC